MKRGELIHRKLYECLAANRTPTIIDAHLAVAHWIDTEYAVRPQAGHLKGRCPLEVFLDGKGPGLSDDDKARLRLLMAEMPVKRIPRDGFKMPWSDLRYYHPDLFGRQNQAGIVRFDWQDRGRIYVYDADGNFICEATQTAKVHPAAAHLGDAEDTAELARQLEMKAHLAKSVTGRAREFIQAEVVPEVRRQIADICIDQGAQDPESAPAAADASLSPEDAERAIREFNEMMAEGNGATCQNAQVAPRAVEEFRLDRGALLEMSDMDRYEALLEAAVRGADLEMEDKRWMGLYEHTAEYKRFRGYFEDTELKFRLMYGAN
jgi:putative transposase